MGEILRQSFVSQTKGTVSFEDVINDILTEAAKPSAAPFRISVGTDSEEIGSLVKYVTIVHLWRVGRGARAYRIDAFEPVKSFSGREETGRFRERIWKEVLLTATLAQEIRSALRDAEASTNLADIEVHADVGTNGRSSVMIREVIGMLKGYGFSDALIKLKPEAYAASAVADRYI
jgi:hypothetical protein